MEKTVIITAGNMSANTYKALCDGVSERFGNREIEHKTDNSLIGGFMVIADGKVYDYSISSKLARFKNALV